MKEEYEPTENRSILPYGDSTLSPSFKSTSTEVSKWKDNKDKSSDKYFKVKCSELQEEYEKLRDDFNMNEMIKQASLQFKPLVGEPYYLYERIKEFRGSSVGSTFLSLISPTEYGASYMERLKFLGCYKVDSHEVWRESRD